LPILIADLSSPPEQRAILPICFCNYTSIICLLDSIFGSIADLACRSWFLMAKDLVVRRQVDRESDLQQAPRRFQRGLNITKVGDVLLGGRTIMPGGAAVLLLCC